MGDYTGIRFKGYVKEKFRDAFEVIALEGDWDKFDDCVFNRFSKVSRSSFIPCGSLSYMPDEWGDNDEDTDGFERTWNKDTGYWTFQCSLKNYEKTIEKWFEIIPYFIEKIEHLEYLFESWTYSKRYDLVNGRIVMTNEKFEKYGYDDYYRY